MLQFATNEEEKVQIIQNSSGDGNGNGTRRAGSGNGPAFSRCAFIRFKVCKNAPEKWVVLPAVTGDCGKVIGQTVQPRNKLPFMKGARWDEVMVC